MNKKLEYTKMAVYYDLFYRNKSYDKEVSFIENFIKGKDCKILDAGCGTGSHSKILKDKGYEVFGFDLNKEMIEIANQKIEGIFQVGNILNYKTNKKFDLIISFFAVFNHLKSYRQFSKALKNLLNLLNENGSILIDLHNPQKNGQKIDIFQNIERKMSWEINRLLNIEKTKLEYIIDGQKYITSHRFKIFNIEKLKRICNKLNLKCDFYENYNINAKANNCSKNIQLVISKSN